MVSNGSETIPEDAETSYFSAEHHDKNHASPSRKTSATPKIHSGLASSPLLAQSPGPSLSPSGSVSASGTATPPLEQSRPNRDLHHKESSTQTTTKKTMSRLQRMFSQTGRRESEQKISSAGTASPVSAVGNHTDGSPSSSGTETPTSSKGALTDAQQKHEWDLVKAQRFIINADGTHQHHLRRAKREEKLRNMLKDMLGGKAKREEEERKKDEAEHAQLSLVTDWVDQVEKEKHEEMAQVKNGPQNQNLVEKYGRCHEVVGRGAFGIVRVSHKTDPKDANKEQLYAVKEFRRRPNEGDKKYTKRLTSEFCISSSLRHPNVIHTLDLLQDAKGDYCEVMEFCAGGDLYSLILAAGKLEMGEADCYFGQLMRGVEYMHEMGVAHRDLKPENLLLTPSGCLKITDFGNGECFRMAWEKEAHLTCGLCGSAPYIAPEEYTDKEFDPRAVDVWACGVIYMAMRTGRHLWRMAKRDEDEFFERYLTGRKDEAGYEPIEVLTRARCRNVIYSILDPNPTRRLTAKQVLKSEFVSGIRVCKAGEVGI